MGALQDVQDVPWRLRAPLREKEGDQVPPEVAGQNRLAPFERSSVHLDSTLASATSKRWLRSVGGRAAAAAQASLARALISTAAAAKALLARAVNSTAAA